MGELRAAPAEYRKKWLGWRIFQEGFGAAHLLLGSLSVALSTVVAANTAEPFLAKSIAIGLAAGAAVAAFALTFLNAKQKNEAFEDAARELEAAMALYRAHAAEVKDLAEAEVRGIRILSRNRPR